MFIYFFLKICIAKTFWLTFLGGDYDNDDDDYDDNYNDNNKNILIITFH